MPQYTLPSNYVAMMDVIAEAIKAKGYSSRSNFVINLFDEDVRVCNIENLATVHRSKGS